MNKTAKEQWHTHAISDSRSSRNWGKDVIHKRENISTAPLGSTFPSTHPGFLKTEPAVAVMGNSI